MKEWNSNFVSFLSNCNSCLVKTQKDRYSLESRLNACGLTMGKFLLNHSLPILIEYRNSKGFSIWNDDDTIEHAINDSVKWFGESPYKVEDL